MWSYVASLYLFKKAVNTSAFLEFYVVFVLYLSTSLDIIISL